jgi:hypothetical protein
MFVAARGPSLRSTYAASRNASLWIGNEARGGDVSSPRLRLGRSPVPCRTASMCLQWTVPAGVASVCRRHRTYRSESGELQMIEAPFAAPPFCHR